jgi:formate dehydrogenase maturation protein FdhE
LPGISVEACDHCRVYVKIIDVCASPGCVPEVDEIASIDLDLAAMAKGYRKLQINLLGV